jgi:outer membrane protein OmpA-like peptidoglycan-associated protein
LDGRVKSAMCEETSMMGSIARWLLVGLLVASGGACTTVLPPERTEAIGPPFNEALKDGYVQLAASRWQAGSWEALHFRDKARQAMLGDAVWPDDVSRASVAVQPELAAQRDRLLAVLDAGGRAVAPADAALAQVSFDCWLSEAGDARTPDSACQESFVTALHATEQSVLATWPESFVVLFEPGSDAVDAVGLNVATSASRAAQLRPPRRISVIGYADPSGPAGLNEALSLQRAENVAAALARAGVSPDLIDVQARGASGAAAAGRRVEIAFQS